MLTKYISRQCGNPSGIGGKMATLFMNILNQKMYRTCIKIINQYPNSKVLDMGFGNGYMLSKIADTNSSISLYGIDISEDMVVAAKKKFQHKNIQVNIGSVDNIVFEKKTFDIVYTINTLYFWNKPQQAFEEIFRVLKDDGIFIQFCYTKDFLDKIKYTKIGFNKMTNEEIVLLHQTVGFSSVEWVDIEKGKSFYLICKK